MKQQELLKQQLNAEETNLHNNASISERTESQPKKLLEREQLEYTPFWVIYDADRMEFNITMGKYKITKEPILAEDMNNAIYKAAHWLQNNHWDIVLTVALCAMQDMLNTYIEQKDTMK